MSGTNVRVRGMRPHAPWARLWSLGGGKIEKDTLQTKRYDTRRRLFGCDSRTNRSVRIEMEIALCVRPTCRSSSPDDYRIGRKLTASNHMLLENKRIVSHCSGWGAGETSESRCAEHNYTINNKSYALEPLMKIRNSLRNSIRCLRLFDQRFSSVGTHSIFSSR